MSTLSIQLPDAVRVQLAAAARKSGKSPKQFALETLEARLKKNGSRETASLFDRSRDLCGSVTGGPRDLAVNKRHLKGYGT